MSTSQRLRIWELRAISTLIGEIGELGANPTAWRLHALEGLVRLTDGKAAMTLDMADALPGSLPRPIDPLDVGWTEEDRQTYFGYLKNEVREDPGAEAILGGHLTTHFLTVTRQQVIDDERWYASPSVSVLRRGGGLDDFVCSSVVWPKGWMQGFIVYRPWGGSKFQLRQRRIMRLCHLGLLRLYRGSQGDAARDDAITDLPPRVAQTLDLLLLGDSPREIATKLYISAHTVNDYTKILYRRLNVVSRGQLLSKFVSSINARKLALPRGMAAPVWPIANSKARP